MNPFNVAETLTNRAYILNLQIVNVSGNLKLLGTYSASGPIDISALSSKQFIALPASDRTAGIGGYLNGFYGNCYPLAQFTQPSLSRSGNTLYLTCATIYCGDQSSYTDSRGWTRVTNIIPTSVYYY